MFREGGGNHGIGRIMSGGTGWIRGNGGGDGQRYLLPENIAIRNVWHSPVSKIFLAFRFPVVGLWLELARWILPVSWTCLDSLNTSRNTRTLKETKNTSLTVWKMCVLWRQTMFKRPYKPPSLLRARTFENAATVVELTRLILCRLVPCRE